MNTILVTAYAINPYKGSEDGMGWNFVLQAATNQRIIAVTRKNNRPHIEKYQLENPDQRYQQIEFKYFDWPLWMLFWKKGPILSLIYYYFWQLSLAIYCKWNKWDFDIVHNLNFHNDWTPSFLWITGKPMVWGPVGHHPKIKREQLKFYGPKALISDRFLWTLKLLFWNFDPFLWITKKKAAHILCMNEDAARVLKLEPNKYTICPSVATEDAKENGIVKNNFTIISAGRFVPLKGFDITIRSFAKFFHALDTQQKKEVKLHLVGSGPYEQQLKNLATELKLTDAILWTNWIDRGALQKLYASSSAFLFPSYEGAGMVVAEAMVHSLPVVCWNNSGPGEFVSKQSLLKVSMENNSDEAINSFASKLNQLYSDNNFRKNESSLSREQYENNFQWNLRGVLLNKIYNHASVKSSVLVETNKQLLEA